MNTENETQTTRQRPYPPAPLASVAHATPRKKWVGIALLTLTAVLGILTVVTTMGAAERVQEAATVPRIEIADFAALYKRCVLNTRGASTSDTICPDRTLIIVDVRSEETYAQGHIEGAISLPEPLLAQHKVDLAQFPPNALIVLYCQ